MSLAATIAAAVAMLLLPRLMMPRVSPTPEVHGFLRILWWVNAAYCMLWHRLDPTKRSPLPEHGAALLIANHTCGIDHFLLQVGARRVLGFLIAREFYDNRLYHPICKLLRCIPVKRDGRDLGATRSALRALEEGRVVPLFPEGKITPQAGRVIGEGRPGVAFLALKSGVPVYPAYIHGTPESNEFLTCLFRPSTSSVEYGPPVDLSDLISGDARDQDRLEKITDRLMGAIRALKDQVEGKAEVELDEPGRAGIDPGVVSDADPAPISA